MTASDWSVSDVVKTRQNNHLHLASRYIYLCLSVFIEKLRHLWLNLHRISTLAFFWAQILQ